MRIPGLSALSSLVGSVTPKGAPQVQSAKTVQAEWNQVREMITRMFEKRGKDLESQDKLGNFEIQQLMSQYNQAETLSANVQKKTDDTRNAIISKIG